MSDFSVFDHATSEVTEVSLFDRSAANDTDGAGRSRMDRNAIEMNSSEDNATRIQCPPFFDGLLCWPRVDASTTATQPCPPSSITDYTGARNNDVNSLASKVCSMNGEWFRNADGIIWSNYSLCSLNHRYIIDDGTEKLTWYPQYAKTLEEFPMLNVSFASLAFDRVNRFPLEQSLELLSNRRENRIRLDQSGSIGMSLIISKHDIDVSRDMS